jgi:hypothetical protein
VGEIAQISAYGLQYGKPKNFQGSDLPCSKPRKLSGV